MKKNLTISIPKPCSEKWSDFAHTSTGGFCGSCSKTVIDFTKMSIDEILDFFKSNPVHTCGRFRSGQLKTYLIIAPPKINPGMKLARAGFLSLLLFSMNKQTFAQTLTIPTKSEFVRYADHVANEHRSKSDQIIRGIVKDEDNVVIPGVNIWLKGSEEGTTTDSEGRFEFPRKLQEGDVLVFSFIGYDTKEYIIPKKLNDVIEISLEMDMSVTLGEVAVDGIYEEKLSSFGKWWLKVKGMF